MRDGRFKVVNFVAVLALVLIPISEQQQQRPLGVASHFPRLPELPPSAAAAGNCYFYFLFLLCVVANMVFILARTVSEQHYEKC